MTISSLHLLRSLPVLLAVWPAAVWAQAVPVPGPVDAGRIGKQERIVVPQREAEPHIKLQDTPSLPAPGAAKSIRFTLKHLRIEGATVFSPDLLADLYAPYIGKEITLDVAYKIAEAITQRYRDAGYFLSLAYVPNQEIANGKVTIAVVEGYIGKVELEGEAADSAVIRGYIERLQARKPVKADEVESFLLRVNDVPGLSFRGVLAPLKNAQDGAVKLSLVAAKKEGHGSISMDNFSSRFLGPNELAASYSTSLLSLQQTTVSGLMNLFADRLRYITLGHSVTVAPDITVEVMASTTRAKPGYTLERFDIESASHALSLGLNYQWMRQRQENLVLKLLLDSRNSDTDFLGATFTRDRLRVLRTSAGYDTSDRWQGINVVNAMLSHGIDGLGSSRAGDRNLSRARAKPDFTKAELMLSRLQGVGDQWSLLAAATGQWASGALYSSEEFGYGGQAFGRAYDASEITGDHGLAASLELRYGGWGNMQPLSLQPFAFYDIGRVWNIDAGQPKRESGASAGLGVRFASQWQQTGSVGLSYPLTRDAATPIYGAHASGPRILLQISQAF